MFSIHNDVGENDFKKWFTEIIRATRGFQIKNKF